MSTPFIGEVRLFAGNFAPVGWAFCDGSLLGIAENDALFTLIGTTYGGDGQATFALPDLRGRIPVHQGAQNVVGQQGGVESVTLTQNQIPAHTHPVAASGNAATDPNPGGNVWAAWGDNQYSAAAPDTTMDATAVAPAGGSQPHENMPPYLAISYIISLFGIYPSQA